MRFHCHSERFGLPSVLLSQSTFSSYHFSKGLNPWYHIPDPEKNSHIFLDEVPLPFREIWLTIGSYPSQHSLVIRLFNMTKMIKPCGLLRHIPHTLQNTNVIVNNDYKCCKNLILPQSLPINYDIAPNNSLGINLHRDKHLQRNKMSFFV